MVKANASPPRLWLALEYLILFFLLPLVYVAGAWPWHPMLLMIPVGIVAVLWYVYVIEQRRATLLRVPDPATNVTAILLLFGVLATCLVAVLWLTFPPERLFWMPRNRPGMWVLLLVAYCLISVVPQELYFRSFFFERYRTLFRTPLSLIAANALAFAFPHVMFDNWIAPVLCLAGGVIFGVRYHKTRSLLLTSFEHALWGMLVLSVGLERAFLTRASGFLWE